LELKVSPLAPPLSSAFYIGCSGTAFDIPAFAHSGGHDLEMEKAAVSRSQLQKLCTLRIATEIRLLLAPNFDAMDRKSKEAAAQFVGEIMNDI
jgi:hypothetical protein